MYKNVLGYAIFLMALAHFRRSRETRETALLLAFAGLSTRSSELTAVLLEAIALLILVTDIAAARRPFAAGAVVLCQRLPI